MNESTEFIYHVSRPRSELIRKFSPSLSLYIHNHERQNLPSLSVKLISEYCL